ncbi:dimethylaniline monooxygenase [N-oxide-forming] 4-like isoform X2 [Tyto alba]|uniref:dimethylaniline monooxygenase [N-oxide-forming] 4-like isoform X2 n=1 Tax=Tyto alba TaxID=56313 RepID=UPI001C671A21|nr:dimethylaniline monooxygenase [N-oxide-forming] 4-like isoform X2 [Tyto alba]
MVRRVAVIGAGAGGLASVKCCLDEGLEPTCFERSEDIGGLWRYTDSTDSGRVSVYRSVITNTSKEMSCFSDFPCPEDFPSFLPHSLLLEYFRMYARHFNLLRHIRFKVFLSARSSTWVFSRVSDHGFPLDMVRTTRFNHFLDWLLPSALMKRIGFWKCNSWFNHVNYGLASIKSSSFKIIVNEELPFCLLSGTIVLKPNVKEFTESSAVFEDGTTEENIDVVLFATGYIFSFPFLEDSVRSLFDDNRSLYKRIFPPQLEKPTLAIIGLVQLTGSVMVGAEMQARWVTGIFAGWNKLPPTSRMMADVLKKKPPVKRNPSERENLKMSFISYTDEIASCAGVKPNVLKLFLTDPRLALAIFFGPCTPYQYRLVGRGKWSGAREAILTQWQRTLKPLRTRVVDDSSDGWHWMFFLALPLVLTAGFLLSKYPRPGWSPQAGLHL